MISYSVSPRDQVLVKGDLFLSYANNMGKNIDKNISKNKSGKYKEKLFDHDEQSAIDYFKITSKSVIQKKTEETSDFIGNKIADKIRKV